MCDQKKKRGTKIDGKMDHCGLNDLDIWKKESSLNGVVVRVAASHSTN